MTKHCLLHYKLQAAIKIDKNSIYNEKRDIFVSDIELLNSFWKKMLLSLNMQVSKDFNRLYDQGLDKRKWSLNRRGGWD